MNVSRSEGQGTSVRQREDINVTAMTRARAQRLVAVALIAALLALPAQAGTPHYDAFCDRDGRVTTKQHGLGLIKLMSSVADLEAVFEDSGRGAARAKRVFEELETSYFPDTGRELAELVSRPPCLVPVLRELSGWYVPDWSFLDFLSKEKPGGVRLRVALLNGYMERARQRNLENQLILSAMTSILGVSVVAKSLRQAGVAASVSRVPEAPSVVTAGGLRQATALRDAARAGGAAARAAELRAAIPAAQQGRITMGVGLAEDASGAQRILIGTSEPRGYLRPGVLLKPGETLTPGLGHAEADIVNFAQQNGLRLLEVGATRPICPTCAAAVERAGAVPVTPLQVP